MDAIQIRKTQERAKIFELARGRAGERREEEEEETAFGPDAGLATVCVGDQNTRAIAHFLTSVHTAIFHGSYCWGTATKNAIIQVVLNHCCRTMAIQANAVQ